MLENNWFIACASVQLKDDPLAIKILGKNIVILRQKDGSPSALLDRCCHRGYPLSSSALKRGNYVCGYHGWEFSPSGKCVRIPSQPDQKPIPSSYCIPSFECKEHDGYVWIWMGDARPSASFRMPEFASGKWNQGSRILNCHYILALEITYDMAHILHVHWNHGASSTARKSGIEEREHELELTPRGCRIIFGNDPSCSSEFELPGRISIRNPQKKNYLHFFVTPVGEKQCRLDFLNTTYDKKAEHLKWVGEGGPIMDEDQAVLEKVQRSYDVEGDKFECSVEADLPTLTMRKIIRAAELGKWNPKKPGMPMKRAFKISYPY